MVYRKIETFQGEEPHTYLVDINPDDAFGHNGNVRGTSFEKVSADDVTTAELIDMLETQMHYGNLSMDAYRTAGLAGFHIQELVSPAAAKQVLWNMIEDKGSTLGL